MVRKIEYRRGRRIGKMKALCRTIIVVLGLGYAFLAAYGGMGSAAQAETSPVGGARRLISTNADCDALLANLGDGTYPKTTMSCESLRAGGIIAHILGIVWMFISLAILCDDFFVPALEVITYRIDMSDDVAGATFMAAGGSAPELFTSFFGVFLAQSEVGFGTIVGSAVFNVLFVIGMCALLAKNPKDPTNNVLTLTSWPLFRDSLYYALTLIILVLCFVDKEIQWYEAAILFASYLGYVFFMAKNEKCAKWVIPRIPGILWSSSPPELQADIIAAKRDKKDNAWLAKWAPKALLLNKDGNDPDSASAVVPVHHVTKIGDVHMDSEGHLTSFPVATNAHQILEKAEHIEKLEKEVEMISRSRAVSEAEHGDGAAAGGARAETESQSAIHVGVRSGAPTPMDTETGVARNGSVEKMEVERISQMDSPQDRSGSPTPTPVKVEAVPMATLSEVEGKESDDGEGKSEVGEEKDTPRVGGEGTGGTQERQGTPESQKSAVVVPVVAGSSEGEVELASFTVEHEEEDIPEGIDDGFFDFPQLFDDDSDDEEGEGKEGDDKPKQVATTWQRVLYYLNVLLYVVSLPLKFLFYYCIPNPKPFTDAELTKPKDQRRFRPHFIGTFLLSIFWIGVSAYFMVWWAEVIGVVADIPPPVMGLTFLAAGTSVPDLLSSIIVARKGLGDMAVSSSIGSNIFDVTVGLPLPWLFKSWSTGNPILVESDGLLTSVIVLFIMLMAVIVSVILAKWKMTKQLGGAMFVLYAIFVAQNLLTEYRVGPFAPIDL